MDPYTAITVYPATGEQVNYWTKLRSVSLHFYQSYEGSTTWPANYVNTPTNIFSGHTIFDGTAQNILHDTNDEGIGLRHGSFGMKGGCYLGPMMTGTPFDFECRGNGEVTSASSSYLDQNYTYAIHTFGGSFHRNFLNHPPLTGISAPWYITTGGISVSSPDNYLIVPWSDFDQGGSFSHEWGDTGTENDDGIVTTVTIQGNFTINLIT